jgi:O-succinylbenzoate synthase
MSMKNQIHIHPYTLRSGESLNARSKRSEHQGVLIRVEHNRGYGYGCIHPWPELGDPDLEQTLGMMCEGQPAPLVRRALYCAEMDAIARSENRSMFDGLVVPRSHATLVREEGSLSTAVDAGFERVKLKVGRDLSRESGFICEGVRLFPDLLWRLDFNHALDDDALEAFLAGLGKETRSRIDFIEDAFQPGPDLRVDARGPYDIAMAVDREIERACGGFEVAVIKPAINDPDPIVKRAADESKRVVFTSYMDHPLGQSFAAWESARAYREFAAIVDQCGLITHGLFEPDVFTEALGPPGPEFQPAAGTGLGFDQLLEDLSWQALR